MLQVWLLIACVCIVIALVLYFFYWNRFIASLIGQAIRILYWNQEGSSIWIEIGSIHFSLLAGRILFKDVRYHSSNQTIKIVKGQIQWRYWIRRPTSEEELNSLRGEDAQLSGRLWSCRIQFSLQGVEWALYNRTAAYDNIIAQIEKATRPASRSSSHFRFFRRFVRQNDSSQVDTSASRTVPRMPSFVVKGLSWIRNQMPSFDSKDLLPLGIKIQKGAIILGNASTPTLLVAEFQNAIGTYGVVPSRSKYDDYKQVIGLHFQSSLIRLVDNDDFVDPMTILGGLVHSRAKSHSSAGRPLFYHSYRMFTRLWRQLGLERLSADYFSTRRAQRLAHKSLATSLPGFKKSRAVEEETPIGIDFSSYEYAIERKILETPALEVTYYVDVVGEVPSDSSTSYSRGGLYDVGNRDTDPEWGFDVVIFGGTLRYGPWADRQRVELQRTFFPPAYQDHDVSPQLKPGDKRVWSALKVLVELRDETSLHIPFREPSKDWQWDGVVEIPHRPRKREPAFFSLTVGDRSSISYILPMVIGPSGYESVLEVHLDTMTITSSLNDIRLISSESSRVHGELPAPLHWNGDRTWTFAASLRHPTLYLLRDHINMLSDLGRDWLSGPPTDYQKFIPMTYTFRLDMQHYEANFYVNDHNIIDRPLIREENALLTMRGPTLGTSTTIPSNTFRPESTSIPFTVSAPGLVGNFSLPRWSTHALNAQKDGISLFKTESFNINGSYRFFAEVRDEHVEQLKLNFNLNKPVFRAFGWAIRYFLVFRENYFGSFTQFQTLSEYLEKRRENLPIGDPLKLKYRPEKSNMLEVEISVQAERPTILLPTSLIGASAHAFDDLNTSAKAVSFTIPEIQLQLRLHDYYMEMSLNYDRITASVLQDSTGHIEPTTPHEIFTIDGIDIVANRLFGPQPRTAVYLCIWEVTFGDIKASMSANQLEILLAASNALRYNFIDLVNAPAQDFAIALDPDVTFYKINVKSVEASWTTGQAALHLHLPKGIKFDRNDLGSILYKRVNSLRVPFVSCKILLTDSSKRKTWLEAAEFSIDIDLDIYSAPHNYQAQTDAQLAFLDEQDRITGRAKRIFAQLRQRHSTEPRPDRIFHRRGVYLPQPALPCRTPALTKSPLHDNKCHPSLHIPTLASLSDTDGEEGVSEADRDARLARTRTSTPMRQTQDDDVAMSSGDESDDADLTDGHSSEDDWSDVGESSQNQEIASLMSFYSPVVRHYTANDSSGPEFWDLPMFELKRDAAMFMRHGEGATGNPNPSPFAMHKLSDEEVEETDTTTLRLKCQLATMTFTPLALPALFLLEEDLQMIMPDSERTVDSLLGRCITKILTKKAPTCSILQMNIHRAAFRVVQHVALLEDGHPDILKARQSSSLPTNLDILSIVELNAAGVCVSGMFHHKTSVISASLGELSGFVDTSVDKRTVKPQPRSAILYLAFASPFIRFAENSLHADLGSISVEVGHNGPELVTAAMLALVSSALCLAKGMKQVQALRLRKQRSIVATILSRSQARPVVDPLSTIQPSYLVQSGDPQSLRTDVSFKFLYHLRNCLRLTKLLDEPLRNEIDVEEFTSLIEARLMHLDPDSSSIDHLTSLDPSLLEKSDSRPLSPTPAITTFGIRLGRMKIAVPAPLEGPPGELDILEVAVDLQFRKQHLVQFNLNNPSSASQTSLRAKSSKVVRNTGVIASIGDVNLIIVPHLMNFAQHILRVKKRVEGSLSDNSARKRTPLDGLERTPKVTHTELIGVLHRLRIQAAAENLVLVIGLDGLRTAKAVLAMQSKPLSINSNVLFEELSLQARSPSTSNQDSDYDLLASLSFTKGYSSIVSRPDSRSRENMKVVVSLAGLKLHVPRSALRLYRFIEEWRADYLPGLEATLNTLLSEYRASPNPPRSPTVSQQFRSNAIIQAHGQIENLEVSLQVMHGTWLLWEMHKTVAYIHNSGNLMLATHSFGVQVDSMVLNVSSKPNATDAAPRSRVKVALPPLSVAGHADGLQIHMLVLLESIDLKVKPSHWDTLLAVQQKFGQDFNDLLVLMQKTRHRAPSDQASTSKALQYTAHIRMQGLRIGLVGLSSTLFLECQDINGGFTSTDGWTWDLSLSDLALSLAPRVSGHQTSSFNRRQRSAFVIIDANLSGSNGPPGNDKNLRLSMSKIQAVMQPSSIGEFGDFVDNLQAEMFERQEQRALELAAFKVKAQSILQTFDVNVGDVQLEKSSWLDDLIITLSIRNVGIAFPLTHDEELHFSRNKTKESAAVRAFLFCIKSINFTASRGETGHATMQRLSFQFVPRFRQSSADDFTAEKHQTRNCLLYPDMRAQLQTSTSGSSRKVWIKADVSGFILDIDSAIPSYVFSLIDVYRQGKERVERMSSIPPRTPLSALPIMENVKPSLEKHYTAVPTSNVFGHLTFLSGKVRFYSMSASDEFKNRTPLSQILLDIPDDQVLDLGAEVFNLPVVSVWIEYRATPASQKLVKDSELEPSLLIFKSTVHSSQNTLRPSLLPFLTELVSRIETRMRKVSSHFPVLPPPPSGASQGRRQETDLVSSMQISFSLRIDKSTMELTCQPDVNVVAGLNWESGGFIVNISPGARKVFFSGSVGGLTLGLKHGFLSEDCVKLDVRNVVFSVSFTKTEFDEGSVNSISVVLDTEFLGGVRFSRLQDILCFKAVWLDRIPVLDSQIVIDSKTPIKSTFAEDPLATRGFSTAILLRIRQISLEVDLGQSVSRLNLDLNQTIFRTTLKDDRNEVFLYIANVSISAQGNISGQASVPSCVFQTIRRSERALLEDQGKSCMLELRLTSGALIADFESDYHNLLHYRAEPLKVEVLDDWSQMQAAVNDKTRPVHLTFTITCPDIVSVITVGTIPKFLSYMNKFQANLDIQRQGAFRESQTFRVTWTPKPDNPLSAVGEAMLQSARNRFKETGVSLVVRQHLRVHFDLLRLIVFPRTMKDLEIAQFSARDVRARLDGLVVADSPSAERNLRLSFSSMVISKYNRSRPVPQRLGKLEDDGREWLTALFQDASEANIVGLPSMKMHMISEEMVGEFTRTLTYDFFSEFVRREGMKAFEDIYITLNMSLYAWLTVLRKNLSREMDQVKASEDWRASMNPSPAGIGSVSQRKKKIPDPLLLPPHEQSRLSTQSGTLSPSGPPSTRLGFLEGSTPASARETLLSPTSFASSPSPLQFPPARDGAETSPNLQAPRKKKALIYKHRNREIERLTMRQLGAATPDVMHPFFMKKAGFSLEDSLPQYVHEYATIPLEEILDILLKLYSRQLLAGRHHAPNPDDLNSSEAIVD